MNEVFKNGLRTAKAVVAAIATMSVGDVPLKAQTRDWVTTVKSSKSEHEVKNYLKVLLKAGPEPGNHLAVDPEKIWSPKNVPAFSEMCDESSSKRYWEICDTPLIKEGHGPSFNLENLEMLYKVNLLVNGLMTLREDSPTRDLHNPGADIGDCEEYVYAKLLILSGKKLKGKLSEIEVPTNPIHPSFLRPTFVYQLVKDGNGGIVKLGHMVLSAYLYSEEHDKFVTVILDNLKGEIYLPNMANHIDIVAVAYPNGYLLEVKR